MSVRITRAIVGVTAFVLLLLGIPLSVVVHRSILRGAVVSLQDTAAHTRTEITVPIDLDQLDALSQEPDAPPPFGLYDPTGTRTYGVGPMHADRAVLDALTGRPATDTTDELVVATPITDHNEQVVGVLRLATSRRDISTATTQAWAAMAASAAGALIAAWLLARRLARQLSKPLVELGATAEHLSAGARHDRPIPSGIAEIDQLSDALHRSGDQITEALLRERRFSADVSHQLRTPLAALRLQLERLQLSSADERDRLTQPAHPAFEELDRLDSTVAHLLALARDATPVIAETNLTLTIPAIVERWQRQTNCVRTTCGARPLAVAVCCSPAGIEQILDILIDNALRHGQGTVTVAVRHIGAAAAIEVRDEGALDPTQPLANLFQRGHGHDNGIGLALARDLAEAEGARLTLTDRDPTTFTLHVPLAPGPDPHIPATLAESSDAVP